MAIIKTVEGKTPRWGKNCFIAENAVLTGDCILGDDCSIWYCAVLRSDVDAIRCGNRVNVQDCACIHQTGTMPCILEDDVSVGHGAHRPRSHSQKRRTHRNECHCARQG